MVVDGAGVEPASRILVHLTVVSSHENITARVPG